jgi:hypothetical protein
VYTTSCHGDILERRLEGWHCGRKLEAFKAALANVDTVGSMTRRQSDRTTAEERRQREEVNQELNYYTRKLVQEVTMIANAISSRVVCSFSGVSVILFKIQDDMDYTDV